jgi:hypothetical protein
MPQSLLERTISADSLKSGYLTPAETAKVMRVALKSRFPHTKFSVRTRGNSVDVTWIDGPRPKAVDRIVDQFTSGEFDGSIDLAITHSSYLLPSLESAIVAKSPGTTGSMGFIPPVDNPKPHPDAVLVRFGAKYAFARRHLSVNALRSVLRQIAAESNNEFDPEAVTIEQGPSEAWITAPWTNYRLEGGWHPDKYLTDAIWAVAGALTFTADGAVAEPLIVEPPSTDGSDAQDLAGAENV